MEETIEIKAKAVNASLDIFRTEIYKISKMEPAPDSNIDFTVSAHELHIDYGDDRTNEMFMLNGERKSFSIPYNRYNGLSIRIEATDITYFSFDRFDGLFPHLIFGDCPNLKEVRWNLHSNYLPEPLSDHDFLPRLKLTGVNKLKKLEILDCNLDEQMASSLSENENLRVLNCRCSNIVSLDLSKNSKLEKLDCSANRSLRKLNLKGCSELKELRCDYCSLSSLNLRHNPKLSLLSCANNSLMRLDFIKNPNLELKNLTCDDSVGIHNLAGMRKSFIYCDVVFGEEIDRKIEQLKDQEGYVGTIEFASYRIGFISKMLSREESETFIENQHPRLPGMDNLEEYINYLKKGYLMYRITGAVHNFFHHDEEMKEISCATSGAVTLSLYKCTLPFDLCSFLRKRNFPIK